jgi:hypothetical protein
VADSKARQETKLYTTSYTSKMPTNEIADPLEPGLVMRSLVDVLLETIT